SDVCSSDLEAPEARGLRRDALDPFGFGDEAFAHRLAAVVCAMAMSQMVLTHEGDENSSLQAPYSLGIETHLKKLANSFAPESPGSDFLDWMAPSNVPDLALWALVAFDNQAFKHVTSETRRRALKRVPQDLESCSAIQSEFGRAVLMAHTLVTGALDEI